MHLQHLKSQSCYRTVRTSDQIAHSCAHVSHFVRGLLLARPIYPWENHFLDIHALYRLSWPCTSLPADLSFCQAEYGLIFVKDFLGWTIQPKNRLLGSEKNYLLCCMAKFNLTTVSFLLKPFHLTSCLQAVSWLTGDSSILAPHCQKLWEPIKYHEIWTLLLLYIPASYGITLIKVYGHKDNWKQSSLETFAQDSYL